VQELSIDYSIIIFNKRFYKKTQYMYRISGIHKIHTLKSWNSVTVNGNGNSSSNSLTITFPAADEPN
jgi:hypothetical protein